MRGYCGHADVAIQTVTQGNDLIVSGVHSEHIPTMVKVTCAPDGVAGANGLQTGLTGQAGQVKHSV